MNNKVLCSLATLGLLPFIIASNCTSSIPNQNPASIFVDGLFPTEIEKIANPTPVSELSEIDSNKVKVAIVGDGVDYNIETLKNRMHYSFDARGRIKGVGIDFVGNDSFAYPQLVDAQTFAFGAKTERGKIIEYNPELFKDLAVLNEQFLNVFLGKLEKDEVLKGSLFAKVNESNINLIGAIAYLKADVFNLEDYEKYRDQNRLHSEFMEKPDPEDDLKVEMFDFIVANAWAAFPEIGLPKIAQNASSYYLYLALIEHADRFDALLKEVTQQFMVENDLEEKLKLYWDYYKVRPGSRQGLAHIKSNPKIEALGALALAFYKHQNVFYEKIHDKLNLEVNGFCSYLTKDQRNKIASISSEKELEEELYKIFDGFIDQYIELDQFLVSSRFLSDEVEAAAKRLKHIEEFRAMLKEQIPYYGAFVFNCDGRVPDTKMAKPSIEYINKFFPPFASRNDMPRESTELASSIAKITQKASIYPIRVTQNTFPMSRYEKNTLSVEFVKYWSEWLEDDVVLEAVKSLVESELTEIDMESKVSVKRAILSIFSKKITLDGKENIDSVYLIQDLIQAVRKIGEEGIPLAFVHTAYEHEVDANRLDTKSFDLEKTYEFLKMELYKYHISKEMIGAGGNTLFVFPSGKAGEWVDGQSRSTLPCQLRSPFFEDFEEKLGRQIPNHRINNVLCVGAITPQKELLGDSNIPLDDTPFVLAVSDIFEARAPQSSCIGNQHEQFRVKYQNWSGFSYLSPYSADGFTDKLNEELGIENPAAFLQVQRGLMNRFFLKAWQMACANKPDNRSFIKGTPLAASKVVGKLVDILADDRRLLDQKDPKLLLERLFEKMPKFGGNTFLKNTPTLFP